MKKSKIKKDSFYLYKAYWNEEKFIHIASKRYEFREGKKANIKVVSGNLEDKACFKKVKAKKREYILTKGNSRNWV